MAETIFVVEDDKDILRLLEVNLQATGYSVCLFTCGAPALAAAALDPPAMFLLDIMLPGGEDGLSLCKRIRHDPRTAACHVIFITAKIAETDRIVGLEIGADEYITKPFSPRELMARIRAVLRSRAGASSLKLCFRDLEIDRDAMIVRRRGQNLYTTTTEFRIIEMLAAAEGRVVPRSRLLEAVWANDNIDPHSVDVYVSRLRSKLEDDPDNPIYLKTVRGIGYRFGGLAE